MIEILTDCPDNIVAAAAHGVVTKHDYQDTLVPRVELTLKRYPKIRCYYHLGAQLSKMEPGAVWEDFKIGVEHLSRWERVAVVTDVEWISAVNVVRFLMPGEVRVFAQSEAASAREWITAVPVCPLPLSLPPLLARLTSLHASAEFFLIENPKAPAQQLAIALEPPDLLIAAVARMKPRLH